MRVVVSSCAGRCLSNVEIGDEITAAFRGRHMAPPLGRVVQ